MLCKDCGRELEAKIAPGDLLCPDCRRNRIEKQKLKVLQEQERRFEREEKERKLEEWNRKQNENLDEMRREHEARQLEWEQEQRNREKERSERNDAITKLFFKKRPSNENLSNEDIQELLAKLKEDRKENEKKEAEIAKTFADLPQLYKLDSVKNARNLLITQIKEALPPKKKNRVGFLHFLLFTSIALWIALFFILALPEPGWTLVLWVFSSPFVLGIITFFFKQKKNINKKEDLHEMTSKIFKVISKLNADGLLCGELKIKNDKPFIMVNGKLQECFLFEEKKTMYFEKFLENECYLEKKNSSIFFAYFEPVNKMYYIVPKYDKDWQKNTDEKDAFIGSRLIKYKYKLSNGKLIKVKNALTQFEKSIDADRALLFLEFDYEESDDEMYNKQQFRNHLRCEPLPCYFLYERILNLPLFRGENDIEILSRTISNYQEHVKLNS